MRYRWKAEFWLKYFAYSRFELFIYSEVWSHFERMYFSSLRKWFSLLSTLVQILWSIDVRVLVWIIVGEQDYDSMIMKFFVLESLFQIPLLLIMAWNCKNRNIVVRICVKKLSSSLFTLFLFLCNFILIKLFPSYWS